MTDQPTEVVYLSRCPEHGFHGEKAAADALSSDNCVVCGRAVEQVAMVPAPPAPSTATAWYHEPLELALVLNWLRHRNDPRVDDVDSVLAVIDRPWSISSDYEQMRDEMRVARESDPC